MIVGQPQAENKKPLLAAGFLCAYLYGRKKKIYLHIFNIAKLTAVLKNNQSRRFYVAE